MNVEKVKSLIEQGEGISVEFKKCRTSLSNSVFESVCAFLNRHGSVPQFIEGDVFQMIISVPEFSGKPTGLVENSEKTGKTRVETLGKTLGKTLVKVLELLQQDPNLTVPEMAKQILKSESAVQRGILKLQKAGLLKRIGGRKGGHWEVVE